VFYKMRVTYLMHVLHAYGNIPSFERLLACIAIGIQARSL